MVVFVGMVLNRSSVANLRSRARSVVQKLGVSAVVAIAYGVIANVCPRAERGGMQGLTMGAVNLADLCWDLCLGGS